MCNVCQLGGAWMLGVKQAGGLRSFGSLAKHLCAAGLGGSPSENAAPDTRKMTIQSMKQVCVRGMGGWMG